MPAPTTRTSNLGLIDQRTLDAPNGLIDVPHLLAGSVLEVREALRRASATFPRLTATGTSSAHARLRRPPAPDGRGDRRRAARPARHAELAPEQPQPFAHAVQSDSPAARALRRVEADAVVGD